MTFPFKAVKIQICQVTLAQNSLFDKKYRLWAQCIHKEKSNYATENKQKFNMGSGKSKGYCIHVTRNTKVSSKEHGS